MKSAAGEENTLALNIFQNSQRKEKNVNLKN